MTKKKSYRFDDETSKGTRAVYCCCECNLLGYLPKKGKVNDVIRFVFRDNDDLDALAFEIETLLLGVEERIESIDAYKSRDYPIEKLRQITGWIDA